MRARWGFFSPVWGPSRESGRSSEGQGTGCEHSTRLNQRFGGNVSVEVGPHMLREVIELAAPHRIPVVTPGKDLGVQPFVESGGEPGLRLFETVERDPH